MIELIYSSHLSTILIHWEEITANLPPDYSASDHLDIVARVFNLKLKTLLDDLRMKHVLGKAIADAYMIEFQMRGLLHAHILSIIENEDKIRDVEFIDNVQKSPISMSIPIYTTSLSESIFIAY